jgi:hypothetical protein
VFISFAYGNLPTGLSMIVATLDPDVYKTLLVVENFSDWDMEIF